jgi:hypothetical protein
MKPDHVGRAFLFALTTSKPKENQFVHMEKRFRGRRIVRTKRHSNRVLVCLEAEARGHPREWISVSTAEYQRGRKHCSVPRR